MAPVANITGIRRLAQIYIAEKTVVERGSSRGACAEVPWAAEGRGGDNCGLVVGHVVTQRHAQEFSQARW